jgi:hypothetical protein
MNAISINFLVAWITLTYAISHGDIFGMGLVLLGFLFMHNMCERMVHESQ